MKKSKQKKYFLGERGAGEIGCPLFMSTIIFSQKEKGVREL